MKKNVNSTEIQLNFVYTFVQSCWKMPVTNGNFISKKKKGKKNIDYQVCGNTNLLLHNSSLTNCYCTEIVLSKLAPQNRHYNFLNFLKQQRKAQGMHKAQVRSKGRRYIINTFFSSQPFAWITLTCRTLPWPCHCFLEKQKSIASSADLTTLSFLQKHNLQFTVINNHQSFNHCDRQNAMHGLLVLSLCDFHLQPNRFGRW